MNNYKNLKSLVESLLNEQEYNNYAKVSVEAGEFNGPPKIVIKTDKKKTPDGYHTFWIFYKKGFKRMQIRAHGFNKGENDLFHKKPDEFTFENRGDGFFVNIYNYGTMEVRYMFSIKRSEFDNILKKADELLKNSKKK